MSSKAAKVMKTNGEILKLMTPAKVLDVIKDYPDRVLLDSDEFLRHKLRAKPLDLEYQLKPKKTYLLVELPRFPKTLRRARSCAHQRWVPRVEVVRTTRRSNWDVSSIMTRSMMASSTDSDDGSTLGEGGTTRVRVTLPRVVVERIMAESRDENEVGQRILRHCMSLEGSPTTSRGVDVVPPIIKEGVQQEEDEEGGEEEGHVVDTKRFNVHAFCTPSTYQRNYKRLPAL